MVGKASSITIARDFVIEMVQRGKSLSQSTLPSIKMLAQNAGVSHYTMWKAIQLLKQENLLQVRTGGRITFAQPLPAHPARAHRWHQKMRHIISDLFDKEHIGPGEVLPSMSELQAKYGLSHKTLHKIFSFLVHDKILVPYKKTFAVAMPPLKHSGNTIALIVPFSPSNRLELGSLRNQRFFDAIESACNKRNVQLQIIGMNTIDPGMPREVASRLSSDRDQVLGHIVWLGWYGPDEYKKRLIEVLSHLSMAKKPVAVFDEAGNFITPAAMATAGFLRIFRLAGRLAGKAVARYLFNLGHRCIRFISYQHGNHWSEDRLAGIREQMGSLGFGDRVSTSTMSSRFGFYELPLGLLPPGKKIPEKVFGRILTREQLRDYTDYFKDLQESHLFAGVEARGLEPARKIMDSLKKTSKLDLDNQQLSQFIENSQLLAGQLVLPAFMKPLFEESIADTSSTAWILADDYAALAALDYLKGAKIKVPEQISVIGFDNTHESLQRQLTTYDFSMPNIVRTMLDFILYPPKSSKKELHAPREIEGDIIHRKSSGPPPGSRGL